MLKIIPIPAFKDNYIWVIIHPEHKQCAIVDPGTAAPVLTVLKQQNLELIAILITHHHWDHSGGIQDLLAHHSVPVWGPLHDSIPLVSNPLKEGNQVILPELDTRFTVLDIPGHTRGHIAFYRNQMVFTGDTLFTGGCGRLFEGTPEQMMHSLAKLSALPEDTLVYCGHEYTLANLQFASQVEPNNRVLAQRLQDTKQLREQELPTVPATLGLERQTNPFLRCHIPSVIEAAKNYAQQELSNPVAVFTAIRAWKDNFSAT